MRVYIIVHVIYHIYHIPTNNILLQYYSIDNIIIIVVGEHAYL